MIAYRRSACISAFIAMFFTTVSSSAIESEWGAGTLARMRLFSVVNALPLTGPADIAVEIKIPDGWKTYWQIPGPAGVATRIDWRESENVESVEFLWPVPKRMIDPNIPWFSSIGYKDGMTLLARVTPQDRDKPIIFVVEADLGVCDDVCIVDYVTTRLTLVPHREEPPPAHDPLISSPELIEPNGTNGLSIMRVYHSEGWLIVESRSTEGFDEPDLFAHSFDTACNERRDIVAREPHAVQFRLPGLCAADGTIILTLVDRGRAVAASVPIHAAP